MASSSTTTTVSGHNAQWEWEGDKSIWQQYPLNIQQDISHAFEAGKKEVNYLIQKTKNYFCFLVGRC